MGLKLEPVAWLTTAGLVGGGLLEADRQFHVLPVAWAHWIAFGVLAVAFVVAGVKARGAVTPLAAPRLDEDTPLVPQSMARPDDLPPPDVPGVPSTAWQRGP